MWCDKPAVKTEPLLDRWQHCVLNKARDSRHRASLTRDTNQCVCDITTPEGATQTLTAERIHCTHRLFYIAVKCQSVCESFGFRRVRNSIRISQVRDKGSKQLNDEELDFDLKIFILQLCDHKTSRTHSRVIEMGSHGEYSYSITQVLS